MSTLKKIWLWSLLVKIVIGTLLPLVPDEAYYWLWGHYIQLGYFDHPAMVGWLFALGRFLEPVGHAVRIPAILMGHLTLWVWILILKKYFPLEKMKAWLWLALSSPIIGFGSLIVTPDIPLVFFWSTAVYFFLEGLEKNRWRDYLGLGISLGLGFCSKYVIVLFVPVMLAYILVEKKWRALDYKKVLGTIAMGFIFSLPVLIWNYQNDFVSFRFQLSHGLESEAYEFRWTWNYILAQILLLFPLVFHRALRVRMEGFARFLYFAAWGPLLFFLATSFRAVVEANWPLIAYPAVFALAAFEPRFQQTTKITARFWFGLYAVVFLSLLIPNFFLNDRLREPFRYDRLAPLVEKYQPLYAGTHQMAAAIWYKNKQPMFKLRDMGRFDFFDEQPESLPTSKKFYLVKEDYSPPPDWVTQQGYTVKQVDQIPPNFVVVEIEKP